MVLDYVHFLEAACSVDGFIGAGGGDMLMSMFYGSIKIYTAT